MTECNAIIEANNEIDELKRENKKLNKSCVRYGFEVGRLEEENERMRQFITKGKRLSVKELMENTNENELLKKKIRGLEKENDDLRTTITKQVGAITEMKDLLYMFADLRIFDYSSEIEEDMQELKKAYDGTLEDFLKYFKED